MGLKVIHVKRSNITKFIAAIIILLLNTHTTNSTTTTSINNNGESCIKVECQKIKNTFSLLN